MNVYEAIDRRRTIRDFEPKQIDRDVLKRILGAGLKAPSHDHLRDWRFVLVDAPELRERLARFFFKERTEEELQEMLDSWGMTHRLQIAMYHDAYPKQASMILGAGALVIPCFRQEEPLLADMTTLHQLNAFASIWAVLENILLAAASEGIFGVTKIISRPEETAHIRETLGIPEVYEAPCYLALGHPREDAVWTEQLKVDVAERIHSNTWVD